MKPGGLARTSPRCAGIVFGIVIALLLPVGFGIANPSVAAEPSRGLSLSDTGGLGVVVKNIPVQGVPLTPLFDPANGDLYVPILSSPNVSVISGSSQSIIANVSVGPNRELFPLTPVLDPATANIYVPYYYQNPLNLSQSYLNLSVISGSTNRVIDNLSIPGGTEHSPTYDGQNGELYVLSGLNVTVISGTSNSVIASIPLGASGPGGSGTLEAFGILYDQLNGDLYVANVFTSNVSVISGATNQVIANLTSPSPWVFGGSPPVLDSANGDVYLTEWNLTTATSSLRQSRLAVISGSTNTLTENVSIGPEPYFFGPLANCSGNDDLYVFQAGVGTNVTIVSGSTNSVVAALELPGGTLIASFPTFDPGNGNLYWAMGEARGPGPNFSKNLSVISASTNEVLGTIDVGWQPGPPTYDSSNGDLYVSTYPNNVTVVVPGGSSGSTQASPFPLWSYYAVSGGIVVVVAIVGGLLLIRSTRRKRQATEPPQQPSNPPSGPT